ncbi:MAG TPA: HAD family hydrolase [Flavitalea sp.]|nr:HAD family hydrolase [Flavitalea sp.]
MSKLIAFFDFDGTITTKDTLLEFIKYSKGNLRFYTGFALHAPVLLAYKLNIISNQRAKEIMLRHFFGRMDIDKFNSVAAEFSTSVVPSLIRPKALSEIGKLKTLNAEIVIVSASPENWISGWCARQGIRCIATRLVVEDNKITGRILGINCHGEEKVNRIRTDFDLSLYSDLYCYGDTNGDLPMLALGTYRFFKPFR